MKKYVISALTLLSLSGHAATAGVWSSGLKEIFGTSYESYDSSVSFSPRSSTAPISRVWFTGAQGILTEAYWPTIDTAQTRDSQFLISDGKSFLAEERKHTTHQILWMENGVPAYFIKSTDPQNRYIIEKKIFTDPNRDAILIHVKITKNIPGLQFYFLHNPAVANTPFGDTGVASTGNKNIAAGLFASQANHAQAVTFSVPLKQAAVGVEGVNDGFQDLASDFRMDNRTARVDNNNIALMAHLDLADNINVHEFDVSISFAPTVQQAAEIGKASLVAALPAYLQYANQWKTYQSKIKNLAPASTDQGKLFRASVAVLKSMEDKTRAGAFVASPSVPWGEHRKDSNAIPVINGRRQHLVSGYHLIWPRDLYHMATAFLSLGDTQTAVSVLKYFQAIQFHNNSGPDWNFGHRQRNRNGSFPQNCWVNGEPFWDSLQMDQTGLPIMLAHTLWQMKAVSLESTWDMVRRAADFIQGFGPWSGQERWEENFGASPNTIAAQIGALWSAAEMAAAMGDVNRANIYKLTADAWSFKPNDNVDSWTFTSTGGLGNGKYFTRLEGAARVDQIWNPNDSVYYNISNGGGAIAEKNSIDGGYLALVRTGIRRAKDPHIMETMGEYDQFLRVNTRQGPSYYRYNGDRYNYEDTNGQQTNGMLWPLLTGERGYYDYFRALEESQKTVSPANRLVPYIKSMENFATKTSMIPEQVWDNQWRGGMLSGEATGAATPLGWAHGEYIKLLRTRLDGYVSDRLPNHLISRARKLEGMQWNDVRQAPIR